jgi:hypothetical protein
MNFDNFCDKLKKLNSLLYVDCNRVVYTINPILGTSGIYLKNKKRDQIDERGLSGDQLSDARIINDQHDEYIGWVTHGFVPEGDKFDDSGKCIARGWRSIVKKLVEYGITTSKKAKTIFGWEQSSYDVLSYEQKVRFECQHQAQVTHVMN